MSKIMKDKMKINHNFLPTQYKNDDQLMIKHNYLNEQFADCGEIFKEIEDLVKSGDYTLGKYVDEFENHIKEITGSRYAIGVGSGTDALFLSLKAAGIDTGDEVITTPYTFYATIGAIVTAGARPIFIDIREDYNINPYLIEKSITKKTKAILPVHWGGLPCEMDTIMKIAHQYNLSVIEDSCQAIKASYKNKTAGTFGLTGCFSMHPLKNLNVWGDGGYIITDSKKIHDKIVLLRNHGLLNRDKCSIFAYNSRLDSIQAIVANWLLKRIDQITEARIANANYYDRLLSDIPQIKIPIRADYTKQVYHLYLIRAEKRNKLQKYLNNNGIDAKIHYPIPMHLQPAAKPYGYKKGDFPLSEAICDSVLSLPVHEYISKTQIEYVFAKIKEFYA